MSVQREQIPVVIMPSALTQREAIPVTVILVLRGMASPAEVCK